MGYGFFQSQKLLKKVCAPRFYPSCISLWAIILPGFWCARGGFLARRVTGWAGTWAGSVRGTLAHTWACTQATAELSAGFGHHSDCNLVGVLASASSNIVFNVEAKERVLGCFQLIASGSCKDLSGLEPRSCHRGTGVVRKVSME